MVSDEKVYGAVSKFLVNRGMEVIDKAWEFAPYGYKGIVAKEENGDFVFVIIAVKVMGDEELPEETELKRKRGVIENAAAQWVANGNYDFSGRIRFDEIALLVANDSRALLRHHINCLD